MKKRLCLVLAMVCLLCAGCGQKKTAAPTASTNTDVGSVKANPDLKVEDCYTYTENKDGTFSYQVEWRGGGVLCFQKDMIRPAFFDAVSEDVLLISGQAGVDVTTRWAMFCDIQLGRVSERLGGYLVAVDNRIACLEQRTGAYHVFVCDPFEPYEYVDVVTLEGMTVADGEKVSVDYVLGEDGVLTVTYPTADGDKTVTISLNAPEE